MFPNVSDSTGLLPLTTNSRPCLARNPHHQSQLAGNLLYHGWLGLDASMGVEEGDAVQKRVSHLMQG